MDFNFNRCCFPMRVTYRINFCRLIRASPMVLLYHLFVVNLWFILDRIRFVIDWFSKIFTQGLFESTNLTQFRFLIPKSWCVLVDLNLLSFRWTLFLCINLDSYVFDKSAIGISLILTQFKGLTGWTVENLTEDYFVSSFKIILYYLLTMSIVYCELSLFVEFSTFN